MQPWKSAFVAKLLLLARKSAFVAKLMLLALFRLLLPQRLRRSPSHLRSRLHTDRARSPTSNVVAMVFRGRLHAALPPLPSIVYISTSGILNADPQNRQSCLTEVSYLSFLTTLVDLTIQSTLIVVDAWLSHI